MILPFDHPVLLCLIALTGACFGSFITMLSHRIPREQRIGATRSRCPTCNTTLGIRDLFPVMSWLLSQGKCRHCHTPIHWRYPAIECATAATFLLLWLQFGATLECLLLCALACTLITLIVIDLEHYIIPDELQIFAATLAIIFRWSTDPNALTALLAGGSLGLATGWLLHYGYFWLKKKHGLGMGDVKFLCVAGLWLGAEPLISFFIISGILGVILGVIWQLCGKGRRFPFGPALAVTLFLQLLWPQYTDIPTYMRTMLLP